MAKSNNKRKALDPHSAEANTHERGFKNALTLFHEAAKRVPAYKDFLREHGVKAPRIKKYSDFLKIPLTNKQNYFAKYSLEELSWDGSLENSRYVSTSSGSTGVPFFWPRGRAQDELAGKIFQNIYEHIFNSKKGTTLVINSFALGTWIAGFEFYNAAKYTIDQGSRMTISTPGIDRAEAINQFKRLAPLYDRVVFAGYPPFIKDIIEYGKNAGVKWAQYDINFFTGGEAYSELWQSRVLDMVGKKKNINSFVNVYGMAETGIVGHDTPFSTLLRRNIHDLVKEDVIAGKQVMGLYQYYPEHRYFESLDDMSLVLTSNAGLPLIRYDTRDTGGILDAAAVKKVAKKHGIDQSFWKMPLVYLFGRKDLSMSLYALNIYVENIKYALENSSVASQLSGLFIMNVVHTHTLDQQFELTIELARNARFNAKVSSKLMTEIINTLCEINSEYSKLIASIGERAHPHIRLVPFGEIETVPGRKHKWVKPKMSRTNS